MENVTLEVGATCGHPPELRGQRVRDVQIFTSCQENASPPDEKAAVVQSPQKVESSQKLKVKPEKSKAKPAKPARKPAAAKTPKNKKTV